MIAALTGADLAWARLNASMALGRSGLLREPALKARTRLAARTQLTVQDSDYYCARLAVAAPHRGRLLHGQTLGANLLDLLEREAREAGASRIVVNVNADQPRLEAFYHRCRFNPLGQAKRTTPVPGVLRLRRAAVRVPGPIRARCSVTSGGGFTFSCVDADRSRAQTSRYEN